VYQARFDASANWERGDRATTDYSVDQDPEDAGLVAARTADLRRSPRWWPTYVRSWQASANRFRYDGEVRMTRDAGTPTSLYGELAERPPLSRGTGLDPGTIETNAIETIDNDRAAMPLYFEDARTDRL
jgi:hypothetical protein